MREPPFRGDRIVDHSRLILDMQSGSAQRLGKFLRRDELAPAMGSRGTHRKTYSAPTIANAKLFRERFSVAAISIPQAAPWRSQAEESFPHRSHVR